MSDAVDEALATTYQDRNPQPKKKQKTNEQERTIPQNNEEKSSYLTPFLPKNSTEGLRRDLKRILIKNPDLDLSQHTEIDEYLNSLEDEDLISLIEAAKFQIGLKTPNGNGVSFLGIIGDLCDRTFKTKSLARKLIEDKELVEWVEGIIPSDLTWMSAPFRILNRILYHVQTDS